MPNLRNGNKGGFEPGLTRLRVRHSTAELPRPMVLPKSCMYVYRYVCTDCVFVVDTWVELHFQQNRTPPNTSAGMFKPINVSNTQMEKLLLEAQRESSSRTSSQGVSQLSSRVGSNPSSRGRWVQCDLYIYHIYCNTFILSQHQLTKKRDKATEKAEKLATTNLR